MQTISTYGSLLTQLNAISSTTTLTNRYSAELSTGNIATDLADNPNRQQVLDLTETKVKMDSYSKSCTLASITTSEYSASLSSMETQITTALKSVQGLMGSYNGRSSAATDPSESAVNALQAFTSVGQTISQTMTEVSISLNEQSSSGGAYLYSGARQPTANPALQGVAANYTSPSVVNNLNTLPYFASSDGTVAPTTTPAGVTIITPTNYVATTPGPAVDPVVTNNSGSNPGLPAYDQDYSTYNGGTLTAAQQTQMVTMAFSSNQVTIDDGESVSAGITSNDLTFQCLANGLRAAHTACDLAGSYNISDRDTYLNTASQYLSLAIYGGPIPNSVGANGQPLYCPGIRALEAQNTTNDTTIQNKNTQLTTNTNLLTTRLESLVGVDTTSVTVQLATANNQLQASYKATATMLGMSLMNYLK